MIAQWVRTSNPCTNCGRMADMAILHTSDTGTTEGLYCVAPECSDAETRAWKAGTQ